MSISLKQFASPLMAKNHFIKASFGGFQGSGKSRTSAEFIAGAYKDLGCIKPVLFIDNEKGSRFLIPFFKKHGIEVYAKDTTSLADVLEAMELLNKGEVDWLHIDSLSKVWYQYVRDYKEANNKKMMYLQDWGKILPEWQAQFSDRFVELNGNCTFTGRGGFQYEMEETEENGRTKKEFVKTGVKMKLAGETPYEPDLNIWMELEQELDNDNNPVVWRTAQILKDRSALIDGKVFKNPTYKDFQPVVKYLIDVPVGEVKGPSNNTNLAPKDDSGYYANQRQREIEIEKFWAEFDWLGTSKDDKAIKNAAFVKVTGTKSKVEFEGFPLATLINCRKNMERLMAAVKKVDNDPIGFIELFEFEVEEPENSEVFTN